MLIHISKYLSSEMGDSDKDSEPSVEKCPLVRFIDAFSSSFFCAAANIFKRNSTVSWTWKRGERVTLNAAVR